MGSCGSVSRGSESAMKMNLSLGVNTDKLVIPPSPMKEKQQRPNGNRTVAEMVLESRWSPPRDYGSKEETFFDTKACMESDCEDDFYSVNGDFTPSRGNTPVHQKFSTSTPPPASISTPTGKKKKLGDLFSENIKDDQGDSNSTTFTYSTNSEDRITDGDKTMRASQGCLPSLMACGSFRERKKKTSPLPPAMAVNEKS